jgi:hypothetical protein
MSNIDSDEAQALFAMLGINPGRSTQPLGRRTGSRIRLLHSSTSATASYAPKTTEERRREVRVSPDQTRVADAAKLRPGFDIRIVDISARGVLVEVATRLHIGSRVELALFTSDTAMKLDMVATVRRCHISNLSPLTYRGALEFNQAIEERLLGPFLQGEALSA